MYLKMSRASAKAQLVTLQNEGYQILNDIQGNYEYKRRAGSFNEAQDVADYERAIERWAQHVITALSEIFPTELEANIFKNTPRTHITVAHGENIAYGSLRNRTQDLIATLNNIIETKLTDTSIRSYQEPKNKDSKLDLPPEIQESVGRLREDHPIPNKTGFVMMRFESTKAHKRIFEVIQTTMREHGLVALRADDKHYHDDLYYNIMTYMYGYGFGIAVYERIESEEFNPNVSVEVGGMLVMRKPICLLKDRTLKTLNTDLIGKLYHPFDSQDPESTIATELSKWLSAKGLAN